MIFLDSFFGVVKDLIFSTSIKRVYNTQQIKTKKALQLSIPLVPSIIMLKCACSDYISSVNVNKVTVII